MDWVPNLIARSSFLAERGSLTVSSVSRDSSEGEVKGGNVLRLRKSSKDRMDEDDSRKGKKGRNRSSLEKTVVLHQQTLLSLSSIHVSSKWPQVKLIRQERDWGKGSKREWIQKKSHTKGDEHLYQVIRISLCVF